MRFLIILTSLVTACNVFCLNEVNGQTKSANDLPGNEAVSIEKLEWIAGEDKPHVAVRFVLKNNTDNKVIKSAQFTIVAQNSKGVILQDGGTTLRKLSDTATIGPGKNGAIFFEKAFTGSGVDQIELKKVIVQFTNGSLEVLDN